MKNISGILPLAFFALLVAAFVYAMVKPPAVKFTGQTGRAVPDFAFARLDGPEESFALAVKKGEVYVVNFFASWCVPCRAEHPVLKDLAKDGGVNIVGVAYKDKPEAVGKFLGALGNPYETVVTDLTGRGGIEWGLTGVPETFVVDRQGLVRFHQAGPLTEALIAEKLLPLLRTLRE